MKKNNRKGFTIVELVIVIAVIAILAAVLVPTFSSVIETANESAALQRATSAYKEACAQVLADGKIDANEASEVIDIFTFTFTTANSTAEADVTVSDANFTYDVAVTNGKVTISE